MRDREQLALNGEAGERACVLLLGGVQRFVLPACQGRAAYTHKHTPASQAQHTLPGEMERE